MLNFFTIIILEKMKLAEIRMYPNDNKKGIKETNAIPLSSSCCLTLKAQL
jgi:hypothetical protein